MRKTAFFLSLALSACEGDLADTLDAGRRPTSRIDSGATRIDASLASDGSFGTLVTDGGITHRSDSGTRDSSGTRDGAPSSIDSGAANSVNDSGTSVSGDSGPSSRVDSGSNTDSDSGGLSSSRASVDGRSVVIDGVPYEIRGVCWNPVGRGGTQPADFAGFVDIDAPMMRAAGINTVRTYDAIRDRTTLDTLAANGIRVLQTVYAWGGASEESALEHVRATMDHDAILAWVVGNEWNYNGLYTGVSFNESRDRLERIAAAIHRIDSRPVVTIYGEVPSSDTIAAMPSIDVWGLNVYRGATFGDLFSRWASLSGKPMFLSEYGADAWDARNGGSENLEAQAYATRVLTQALLAESTARNASGITLGGTVFEWADEWWKDQSGNPNDHDVGGVAPGGGPHPDQTFNEEWWGVVDIDRNPRPAYTELQNLYVQ